MGHLAVGLGCTCAGHTGSGHRTGARTDRTRSSQGQRTARHARPRRARDGNARADAVCSSERAPLITLYDLILISCKLIWGLDALGTSQCRVLLLVARRLLTETESPTAAIQPARTPISRSSGALRVNLGSRSALRLTSSSIHHPTRTTSRDCLLAHSHGHISDYSTGWRGGW